MALPSVIIAQAIGRWGNFFNGEAYGPVTTLAYLQSIHIPKFIINGMNTALRIVYIFQIMKGNL